MQRELKQLNRTLGITFILVTHDQEEALVMSDRIAVMHEGRVAQVGTPAAIYETPRTAFVADFIGEANFFSGTVRDVVGGMATVVGGGEATWRVPAASPMRAGSTVRIAVRPEWHELRRPGGEMGSGNALPGIIAEIIFLGETLHVLVTLTDGTMARVALRNEGVLTNPLVWHTGDPVLVC